jgi:3-hydroxyisobutyrate dehydrogenase-like beta-hydroxyacid dehydrogenase
MTAPLASVGIISIGEMGLGIAKLLIANNYRVLTNLGGRSQSTKSRAESASIDVVTSDNDLVAQSDYILSIVPPRDAKATADRIITAHNAIPTRTATNLLYFLDLNAIAPSTARSIASAFNDHAKEILLVDGGIIGGPPKHNAESSETGLAAWSRPGICVSGPNPLSKAPKSGAHLAEVLNTRHVSDGIGTASGLKCCFASLTKGFTALAIQSFSTASALGVLPALQDYIQDSSPANNERAKRGLTSMPPKAGRWVEEMREIGKTFAEDGGWEEANVFHQVAEVYEFIAKGTVLGEEKTGERVRGKSVDDVAAAIGEGHARNAK